MLDMAPGRLPGADLKMLTVHKELVRFRNNWVVLAGFALLMVWNVALPKGGVDYQGIPITFGYLALGAATVPSILGLLRRPDVSVFPLVHLICFYVPLGMMALYKALASDASTSNLVVDMAIFLAMPTIFLLLFAPFIEDISENQIGIVLKWCIRFVVIWGLMNFILYIITKQLLEIPYITVNAGDLGRIYNKNNRRGALMKLVSSYNNGNIFGVCMVMLAPVYVYFEKSRLWIVAFCAAIILTLSRTAWFGLACVFVILTMIGQVRLSRGYVWAALAAGVAGILLILPLIGWTSDKLVDRKLGGRLHQLTDLEISWFGAPTVKIQEIVYAGLLQSFGVLGFLVALLALSFAVIYGLATFHRISPFRRAALAGCLCYLFAAMSDGAFIFPPVIAIYLFLNILVYRRGCRWAAQPAIASSPKPIPPALVGAG